MCKTNSDKEKFQIVTLCSVSKVCQTTSIKKLELFRRTTVKIIIAECKGTRSTITTTVPLSSAHCATVIHVFLGRIRRLYVQPPPAAHPSLLTPSSLGADFSGLHRPKVGDFVHISFVLSLSLYLYFLSLDRLVRSPIKYDGIEIEWS